MELTKQNLKRPLQHLASSPKRQFNHPNRVVVSPEFRTITHDDMEVRGHATSPSQETSNKDTIRRDH